jgi:hypothetical protein
MPRTVRIDRSRLTRWLDNFVARHGDFTASTSATAAAELIIFRAADGAEARIEVPFPPLSGSDDHDLRRRLVDHVRRDRRTGAVLVRRGGYAVGIFDGTKLIRHKVGSAYVQGKTKAGGWSQQRYARRRDNQARQLYERAAAAAEMILVPEAPELVAVFPGGDREGIAAVLDFPSLQAIRAIAATRVLPTEDPRLKVLEAFPDQFLALDIELNDQA